MIRYVSHNEIDKIKWDKCIDESPNGLVYACSWYLDIVCPGWGAIIEDDYASVMPLPIKRKFGFKYLIRPYLTQQLGIFSIHQVSETLVNSYLKQLLLNFKYCHFYLNIDADITSPLLSRKGITYELTLQASYDKIYNNYSTNNKRNLKKALYHELKIYNLNDADLFFNFYMKNGMLNTNKNLSGCIKDISNEALKKNKGEIKAILNKKGEPVSAVLWINYHKRVIYLVAVNNIEGKNMGGNFLLIDNSIRENAEKRSYTRF